MKKTLFLSAILGAALCSSAFAESTTITGAPSNIDLTSAAYSGYDLIIFNTTAGHLINGNKTFTQDIQIGDGTASQTGMLLGNGYGDSPTFTGAVTGSGEIKKTGNGKGLHIVFAGNVTEYTGNITLSSNAENFEMHFGNGNKAASTTAEKGVSGTGSITFASNNNTLVYSYASGENPVYITNTIVKSGNVTSKVNFKGGASYVLTKNAAIDELTIGDGSSVTVNEGVTLALKSGSSWHLDTDVARTTGNGLGLSATYSRDFGTTLVNNGKITVDGQDVTYNNGLVRFTGNSTTYYINDASATYTLGSAAHAVIDTKTKDTAVTFTGAVTSLLDMDIKSGLVVSSNGYSGGTGFVSKGDVTVHGGATLQLAGGQNDVLGYNGAHTKSITLIGAEGKVATLDIAHTNAGSTTTQTNLNLSGNALVESSTGKALNAWGAKITATGTNNKVTADILLRKSLNIEVTNAGDTLTLNKIGFNDNQAEGVNTTLTKQGAGSLEILGDIDTRGTINGADTTIIKSRQITANTSLTLKNVTFSKDTHYVNNTINLAGTINVETATTGYTDVARESGNGYGTRTFTNLSFLTGSGKAIVDAVTLWKINGLAADMATASYADGCITATTDSYTYYVNSATTEVAIDKDTTLVSNLGDAVLKEYIGLAAGKTLTITDGQKLTMLPENPSYATNKGVWMGAGSSIVVSNGGSLTNYGVTVENATITNTATSEVQYGTHNNQEINRHFITIEGDITVENGTGELQSYTITGGSVTVNSGTTTTIKSDLSDTTALTVNSGSIATFSGDASVASVAGAGALALSHNLTIAGNATIGSLTLSNGADITAETISGEHNGKITLTELAVTAAGSEMNGDLIVSANGALDFTAGHVLTMGCSVEIGEGVKVYISGSADDIRYGQEVTIMESVDEAITLNNALIYVNNELQSDFSLKLTDDHRIVVAPEPATATLSLLALAGLMARRRRH